MNNRTDEFEPLPIVTRQRELEDAIRDVVTQPLDDICWFDVYQRLAALVGVTFDPLLLTKEQMLGNCERFVTSLLTGCPYATDRATERLKELERLAGVRPDAPRNGVPSDDLRAVVLRHGRDAGVLFMASKETNSCDVVTYGVAAADKQFAATLGDRLRKAFGGAPANWATSEDYRTRDQAELAAEIDCLRRQVEDLEERLDNATASAEDRKFD